MSFSADEQQAFETRLGKMPVLGSLPPQLIPARLSDQPVSLAPAQEQIWRRSLRAEKDSALYNESITIHRRGPLDVSVLEACLAAIIRRHQAWRTTFAVVDDFPMQFVRPAPTGIRIAIRDLTQLQAEGREEQLSRLVSEQARRPFDLCEGPLLRATLFKTDVDVFRLSIIAHQSIVDGISAYQILHGELAALYVAFSEGRPSPLPPLPIQYGDFSIWHRHRLQTGMLKSQLDYWEKQLVHPLPAARWPRNRPAVGAESFRGAILPFVVPLELSDRIANLSRHERVTLFMVLLAGFAALLHAYTDQEDLAVATLSPCGRKQSETQRLLGYFLNPVALRFDFSENPKFSELLVQARCVLADAISHDDVPLELLEDRLGLDTGRDPFIKVAISLQPRAASLGPEWDVTTMDARDTGTPWDFYLAFIERDHGLIGRAQYNPDLLAESDVARALHDLWQVLEIASSSPGTRVVDLSPP